MEVVFRKESIYLVEVVMFIYDDQGFALISLGLVLCSATLVCIVLYFQDGYTTSKQQCTIIH